MVKQIYSLCLAGNGPTKIARMLTEQNIPTPGQWRTGKRITKNVLGKTQAEVKEKLQ